jgi:hypothetical protein
MQPVSKEWISKHIPTATNKHATIEEPISKQGIGKHTTIGGCWKQCFLFGPCKVVIMKSWVPELSHVEAGSNTSTVALRVVGGDKKGRLESETVKYGRKSHRTQTQEWLHWPGPAAIVNDRPILSSETAPHINKFATDSNKNLIVSPKWVLCEYSTTNWLTVHRP